MSNSIKPIDEGLKAAKSVGIMHRSQHWDETQKAHLKKYPTCAVCNATTSLQVHHIFPFEFCIQLGRADLELDERNLITLCQNEDGKHSNNHHLLIGHLDDFKSFNIDVRKDASVFFNGMTDEEIKISSVWKQKHNNRPMHLINMTIDERKQLRVLMDTKMPLK